MCKSVKNWLQKCIFHLGEIFMNFFCLFWNCLLATSLSKVKNVTSQPPVDITYITCIFWGGELKGILILLLLLDMRQVT